MKKGWLGLAALAVIVVAGLLIAVTKYSLAGQGDSVEVQSGIEATRLPQGGLGGRYTKNSNGLNTEECVHYKMDEPAEQLGLVFTVKGWQVTKERQDFPPPDYIPMLEGALDSDGNLTNGLNYLVVELEIENGDSLLREYYLNSFMLLFTLPDGESVYPFMSEISIFGPTDKPRDKDYFRTQLAPGESGQYCVAVLVEDGFVEEDMQIEFVIYQGGFPLDPDVARVVDLQ